MGACVQVCVDAWRRQGICAHGKQTAILKRKEKPLSEERYAKSNFDDEQENTIL